MNRIARLAALAEQDLIDIWQYSAERWSTEQADSYLDAIGRAIQQLTANPQAGVARDDVRAGYRALFVNQHAIYYLITAEGVQIGRVLSVRMDPYRHV